MQIMTVTIDKLGIIENKNENWLRKKIKHRDFIVTGPKLLRTLLIPARNINIIHFQQDVPFGEKRPLSVELCVTSLLAYRNSFFPLQKYPEWKEMAVMNWTKEVIGSVQTEFLTITLADISRNV